MTTMFQQFFGGLGGQTTAKSPSEVFFKKKPVAPVTPAPMSVMPTSGQTTSLPMSPLVTPFAGKPAVPQVTAPSAPTTATRPATPAPAPNAAAGVMTPSGAMVDPNTGALLTPPPGQNTANTGGSTAGTPATPQVPQGPTAAEGALSAAEKAYQRSLEISPEELSTQEDLDRLIESTKKSYQNTEDQTIPLEFITGQMASIERRATGLAEPLERKLARLQAARTSSLEASKYALSRAEQKVKDEKAAKAPIEVGDALVQYNPSTGKYETVFGAAKAPTLPASAQEYEYAKTQGYTGTFQQYQNEDANRKRSVTNINTGTAADPQVDAWVKLIQSGQAKITSVPASLKTAVATAMGASAGGTNSRNLAQEAVDAITFLETAPGKGAAIGASFSKLVPFGMELGLQGDRAGYLAKLDQVKSLLTLPNLQYLRGLGAMSDREFKTVADSVAALDPRMSESSFNAEMARIKEVMQAAALKYNGGGQTTAPASGGQSTYQAPSGNTYQLPY